MRTLFIVIVGIMMSSAPSALADHPPSSPAHVAAVGTIAGTFLAWTPSPDVGATYVIYRGDSPDNLSKVGWAITPRYYDPDVRPAAGQSIFYGIAAILDGAESEPTILNASPRAACVTVGTNGHVNLRPYNCLA